VLFCRLRVNIDGFCIIQEVASAEKNRGEYHNIKFPPLLSLEAEPQRLGCWSLNLAENSLWVAELFRSGCNQEWLGSTLRSCGIESRFGCGIYDEVSWSLFTGRSPFGFFFSSPSLIAYKAYSFTHYFSDGYLLNTHYCRYKLLLSSQV
jgi:hypothetical protein